MGRERECSETKCQPPGMNLSNHPLARSSLQLFPSYPQLSCRVRYPPNHIELFSSSRGERQAQMGPPPWTCFLSLDSLGGASTCARRHFPPFPESFRCSPILHQKATLGLIIHRCSRLYKLA